MKFGLALLGILLLQLAGCSQSSNKKPEIITTAPAMSFLASQIAGDKFAVTNLTPSGIDPHEASFTSSETAQLLNAQLVIQIPGLQPALDETLNSNPGQSDQRLSFGSLLEKSSQSAEPDPHFWLDLTKLSQAGNLLATQLSKIDPKNQASYSKNAAILTTRLTKISKMAKVSLRNCAQRDLLVSHNAFGYLAKKYRLTLLTVKGADPHAEPNPAQLANLIQTAKAKKITTVFTEPNDSSQAKMIATELAAKLAILDPFEVGNPAKFLVTYQKNINQIAKANRC